MPARISSARVVYARLGVKRILLYTGTLWILTALLFWSREGMAPVAGPTQRMRHVSRPPPLPQPIPCHGARGVLLPDSPDDHLDYIKLDNEYPIPFFGSQKALGLDETWITAEARYGPYGFSDDTVNATLLPGVDWDKVDWGQLQAKCLEQNRHRFPSSNPKELTHYKRFTLLRDTKLSQPTPSWDAFNSTRRTALVLRSYSSFEYKPQIMWYIRSLITEAALQSGAEYSVFLLVHVQDPDLTMFQSEAHYEAAFAAANIPPELQSIAVLWDDNLPKSWYKKVKEHNTDVQLNQPLQLFALHYPEFDYYWQLEMGIRFLGHAGQYLDTMAAFARSEPRRQALERATFPFNETLHGTYANFTASVNTANRGETRAWGPVRLPKITPIGPVPPVVHAPEDDFTWGVGEEADIITSSFCADVRDSTWMYKGWHKGLAYGDKTPRWWCPSATSRVSRALALVVHEAQYRRGVRLGGEAMFPTFALWHGLKLSYPPQPVYLRRRDGVAAQQEDERVVPPWFGWSPERSGDGVSHGNPQADANYGLTWWWTSSFGNNVMDVWIKGDVEVSNNMPSMLAVKDGKVYAPNFAMHPVKVYR